MLLLPREKIFPTTCSAVEKGWEKIKDASRTSANRWKRTRWWKNMQTFPSLAKLFWGFDCALKIRFLQSFNISLVLRNPHRKVGKGNRLIKIWIYEAGLFRFFSSVTPCSIRDPCGQSSMTLGVFVLRYWQTVSSGLLRRGVGHLFGGRMSPADNPSESTVPNPHRGSEVKSSGGLGQTQGQAAGRQVVLEVSCLCPDQQHLHHLGPC